MIIKLIFLKYQQKLPINKGIILLIIKFPLRFDLEGDVSDWKYDRGGLTKRGITQVVVKKYFPGKKVTDLNNDQLEFIARSEFDRTMKAGLPNNSGVSMADFDFNSGSRHTNTVMRRTLRDMYGIPLKAMMVKGTLMSRVEPERRILEKIIKQRVNSQQEDEKLAEKHQQVKTTTEHEHKQP